MLRFFLVAYLVSWTAWIILFTRHLSPVTGSGLWLSVLAVAGPHLSAALNTALAGGRAGLREFYGRLSLRVPLRWAAVAIAVPPIVYLTRDAIAAAFRLPHQAFFHHPPRTLPVLLLGQLTVVLGEEPGWRGYALPRLAKKFGFVLGTLVLGIAWTGWHLPLFLIPGTPQHGTPFLSFAVLLTASSLVMTLTVRRARGNIVPAMLFHASGNLCAFTMWEPASQVFNLAPWVIVAVIAAWLIPKR